MIHSAISKPIAVSGVRESGFDGNLAKGELAVISNRSNGVKDKGIPVVTSFAGMSKNDRIQIKVGEVTTPSGLRVKEVASLSTGWFALNDVLEISAHVPSQVEVKTDWLETGFDGIKDASALYIPEGKSATFDLMLYGEVASMFFGDDEYLITKQVYRPVGATMQEVIQKLVKELNEERVPTATGWSSVTDQLSQFLEIGVIDSSNNPLSGVSYTFSSVEIPDNGDSNDLAKVQMQYPAYKVKLTDRNADTRISTYTILHPSSVTLSDVSIISLFADNKGCEDCLAGYSEIAEGVVYHIAIEDDNVDQSTLVDNVPGYVSGTVSKIGNEAGTGMGIYSVVVSAELTQTQVDSFLSTDPVLKSAIVSKRGTLEKLCYKESTATYSWIAGQACKSTVKQFNITLPDSECGTSRLAELQSYFPELVIEEGKATGSATQTVTLTGSSGDAVLTINGVNYTRAYNTSLTQTATDFVTNNATAILAATGLVVTSAGAVLTFTGSAVGFPTIVSVAGGLTETVSALDYLTVATAGGCKRVYSTYVPTNLVCPECSDIFLQQFYAEAPQNFDNVSWEEVELAFDEDAKMGIVVKGKPFFLYPEIYEEDFVPYVETSLKVKSMTFGASGDLTLNYTGDIYDPNLEFAPSRKVRYAEDVNNNAAALFGAERMGHKHFTNKTIFKGNLFARTNLSQERILKYHQKIVQYAIKWKDGNLSQGGASRSDITHETVFYIQYGKHQAVQNILNKIAAKVGLEVVKIL